jgi:hypothetical protein
LVPFEISAFTLVLSFWSPTLTEPGPVAGVCVGGEDQNDLSAGQPEFGFTISFDSQDIKEATRESAGCSSAHSRFILLILV